MAACQESCDANFNGVISTVVKSDFCEKDDVPGAFATMFCFDICGALGVQGDCRAQCKFAVQEPTELGGLLRAYCDEDCTTTTSTTTTTTPTTTTTTTTSTSTSSTTTPTTTTVTTATTTAGVDACDKAEFCEAFCREDGAYLNFTSMSECQSSCSTNYNGIIFALADNGFCDKTTITRRFAGKVCKDVCVAVGRDDDVSKGWGDGLDCKKPCKSALQDTNKLGGLFGDFCAANCPTPTTTTTTAPSVCTEKGFCSDICSIGFLDSRCLDDCTKDAMKITTGYCRCGLCAENHLLEEIEESNLLHMRVKSGANATSKTSSDAEGGSSFFWNFFSFNSKTNKTQNETEAVEDFGADLIEDLSGPPNGPQTCRCRNRYWYCDKLCDDGLKCVGARKTSCVQKCQYKWDQVEKVLEEYKASCKGCGAPEKATWGL
mmetsp:Transcript_68515/g.161189  ORF Transcript_68515/g.161189 Transcript_68515/m.161189 type:complete len:432 (-) Transcript_68515:98-1393(-)